MSGDEREPGTAFSEAQIRAIASVVEGVLEKARLTRRHDERDTPQEGNPSGSHPPSSPGEWGLTRARVLVLRNQRVGRAGGRSWKGPWLSMQHSAKGWIYIY